MSTTAHGFAVFRSKMGATLTERYEMKDRGTKRLTNDFEKLRKDLKKVCFITNVSHIL